MGVGAYLPKVLVPSYPGAGTHPTGGDSAGPGHRIGKSRRRPPQPWEAARRRAQMQTLGNINRQRKIERDAREAK